MLCIEPAAPVPQSVPPSLISITRHGMVEKADEVRQLMGINNRVSKETECSWIEFRNQTFVCTVNDKSHSRTDEIYELLKKLKELVKKRGCMAEIQFATNSVEGSELKNRVCGVTVKNLRTLGDCHAVKYILHWSCLIQLWKKNQNGRTCVIAEKEKHSNADSFNQGHA